MRGFDPLEHVSRSDARRLDRHALYAIGAAQQAMPGFAPENPARFCVTVATGSGPVSLTQDAVRALDELGPRRIPPGVVVYGGPDAAVGADEVRRRGQAAAEGVVGVEGHRLDSVKDPGEPSIRHPHPGC